MANSKEIGRIGQRRYGGTFYEEFLPELRGRKSTQVFYEMSENDDVVGAILFAIEMLVRQCDWNVNPVGNTAKDKEAAEFVESCMNDMQTFSFGQIRIDTEKSCKCRLCQKKGRSHIDLSGHFLVTFLVKNLGVFGHGKEKQYIQ